MTPRKHRNCTKCGAVLSIWGEYLTGGKGAKPLCWAHTPRTEGNNISMPLGEPDADDPLSAIEDSDYPEDLKAAEERLLTKLRLADLPTSALRTSYCKCENPSRYREEDGVRCMKCSRWLSGGMAT